LAARSTRLYSDGVVPIAAQLPVGSGIQMARARCADRHPDGLAPPETTPHRVSRALWPHPALGIAGRLGTGLQKRSERTVHVFGVTQIGGMPGSGNTDESDALG
jgi:hypothetical protein